MNKKITRIDRFLASTLLRLIPNNFLPNYFTIFRLISIPFIIFLFLEEKYLAGFILFILSVSTDFIDGALARTRNQITEWGTKYDPLADKLLIMSLAFILIIKYFPLEIPIIIVANELLLVLGYLFFKKNKKIKIQPNIYGKLKMIFQSIGIIILLLYLLTTQILFFEISRFLIYASIPLGIFALIKYFRKSRTN